MATFSSPSRRVLRTTDAGVAAFVVLCLVLGFWVFSEVRDVRSLTTTLGTTGRGLERAGMALEGAPSLLSDDLRRLGADARTAGRQAQASAVEGRDSIDTVSVLAGLTIALVPTLAVLLVYVPLRSVLRGPAQRGRGG